MVEKSDRSDDGRPNFSVKRCPYCSTYLGLQDIKCSDCGRRVGPSDANGIAKKPVDWVAYLTAAVACAVLAYFVSRYL